MQLSFYMIEKSSLADCDSHGTWSVIRANFWKELVFEFIISAENYILGW